MYVRPGGRRRERKVWEDHLGDSRLYRTAGEQPRKGGP